MNTEGSLYNHRIINGVLKAQRTVPNGAAAHHLLKKNIEIICDPNRAKTDLWPCIWAMATALARQFAGTIYINCALTEALAAPVELPENCVFTGAPTSSTIRIGIGLVHPTFSFVADARGNRISIGKVISGSSEPAHPISSFAVAGYTGFAAMATAAQIPSFRESFANTELELPFTAVVPEFCDVSLIGLGQLGQAYLALLYFLSSRTKKPRLFVVDKDAFENPNFDTQILLAGEKWEGMDKTEYIENWAKEAGFECVGEKVKINWGWKLPAGKPKLALLGLDDFDVRRMCANAGFDWLVESGLGTSFAEPKVTWHSFPPNSRTAAQLFGNNKVGPKLLDDAPYAAELKRTQGGCGWVTFNNISSTAPSLGLVGSAYAFSELLEVLRGKRTLTTGSAYIWSPLIPFLRREGNQVTSLSVSKFLQKQ